MQYLHNQLCDCFKIWNRGKASEGTQIIVNDKINTQTAFMMTLSVSPNCSTIWQRLDFIECFTTTFLRAHSWLNWVDEDDDEHDEHDEVGLKEKPEDTRYIKKITSK